MLVLGPPTLDAYDPATNTWQPIPIGGPNEFAVVAWTGREAIVWGGVCCGDRSNNGTAYDPSANAWSPLPTAPLQPRRSPMGAWTGKELIVGGGWTFRSDATLRCSATLPPTTRRPAPGGRLPPMPRPRGGTALWDGKEVLFIGGGRSPNASAPRGMAYNPATIRWRPLPAMKFHRSWFAAVWTGRRVLVWAGLSCRHRTRLPGHRDATG